MEALEVIWGWFIAIGEFLGKAATFVFGWIGDLSQPFQGIAYGIAALGILFLIIKGLSKGS